MSYPSSYPTLLSYLKDQDAQARNGKLSRIKGRFQEDRIPWDLKNILKKYLPGTESLLEMFTNSGEFMNSMDGLPRSLYAVDKPDAGRLGPDKPSADKAATERLVKGGRAVLRPLNPDGTLPFDDAFFDVILNRNGMIKPEEIRRVLKPGGVFISQQFGGLNNLDLNFDLGFDSLKLLNRCLVRSIELFRAAGMEVVEQDEWFGSDRFYDIGAVVYYLRCIHWHVTDFNVERYFPRLQILSELIERKGYLDSIDHRFYLVVRKPQPR